MTAFLLGITLGAWLGFVATAAALRWLRGWS